MRVDYLEQLKEQFNNRISFRERRPGVMQLVAPLYYEDGDMMDMFIEPSKTSRGQIKVSDYGMTLQHLAYSQYEIDTPKKEEVFQRILAENGLKEDDGSIYVEVEPKHLYSAVLQFSQVIAKVSNMQMFSREVIRSMFYEHLKEFVMTELAEFQPQASVYPLRHRDDLEVPFALTAGRRPIYLFGVKDSAKARETVIALLEFQLANLSFRSIVVHEDFDSLPRKDATRLTSVVDKQFVSLDDGKKQLPKYLKLESAN